MLSFILDLISFFMQVGGYKEGGDTAFSDVALLFLACIFMTIDLYYVAWVFSTSMKLPGYAASYVTLGLIGLISRITKALDERLASAQANQRGKYEAAATKQKARRQEMAK